MFSEKILQFIDITGTMQSEGLEEFLFQKVEYELNW